MICSVASFKSKHQSSAVKENEKMADLPPTFVPGFHDENEVRKMKYTKFGETDLMISHLSLGAGGFAPAYGEYTLEECRETVIAALKSGINYIDTAPYYGDGISEELVGKCLEGIPRKAFYIATKVCRYSPDLKKMFDFSAEKTKQSIETSLKRLGCGYIDILQVHDIEFAPSLDIVVKETLPTVQQAVKEGKVRYIGVTGYPVSTLAECIKNSTVHIDSVLCYTRLSLLNNTLKEYLPFFQSKKLGIVNAAVHCLGLLTNGGPPAWHIAPQDIKEVCTQAREYCKKINIELGKLALYYALHQPGPHTNLVGMNTRKLLKTNLDVLFNGLTGNEKAAMEYVKTNFFDKLAKTDWEGIEVADYWKVVKS